LGVGAASTKDPPLAETCFALRRQPHPGLASVGTPALSPSGVDKGFEGQANQRAWWTTYGAQVICPPKRHRKTPWPKPLRRWCAGVRQRVETVHDKLQHTFRLDRERPEALSGLQARVAAKIALPNFCMWWNEPLGRPRLACMDLVDWEGHAISHQAFKYQYIGALGSVAAIKHVRSKRLLWEFWPLDSPQVLSLHARMSRQWLSTDISIRDLSPVGGLILPLYSVVAHRNAPPQVRSM